MAECSECARLTRELRLAQATIQVRTWNYGYPERPKEFLKSGARSAYDSGYATGWLNRPFSNCYTRPDCRQAYAAGYRKAEAESLEEIGRLVGSSK